MLAEGINDEAVVVEPNTDSNYSTILLFKGERTIITYHSTRMYKMPEIKPAKWIFLTSAGDNFKDLYSQAVDYTKKVNARLAFNPGTRQIRAGLDSIRDTFGRILERNIKVFFIIFTNGLPVTWDHLGCFNPANFFP